MVLNTETASVNAAVSFHRGVPACHLRTSRLAKPFLFCALLENLVLHLHSADEDIRNAAQARSSQCMLPRMHASTDNLQHTFACA